jgi:hypothetical protein
MCHVVLPQFYGSPDIIKVNKSGRLRWAENVGLLREKRAAYGVWWKSLKGRENVEHLGLDEKIILKEVLKG